ncbi:BZ3500_MvSof-1268-A1-R1_Chr1-3g02003 [Microbotryum saponariae]|uniref:BZ3500_MvSof-1268-A1-R1_Chr1-3g02003 protein n=1 Tax=Microbotryum saponariae TaxID=289078 RepID=A0A2X0KSD4_9BASI|nr:BZ3500_MvSof-1268-A1-R1_Chr1-3g02003 [Microbotryum saponariae]SCZ95148.1 BZ3501_MvSof-1269-A2-R1_Chr1-3g01605 [Microbotryum saponariae]
MYMLHRITRSADVPVSTHPDEALDKTSFRIGNAGAVGPEWTTASSASGSDHRGNTLSNAETTPKPVPTRLETFLNLLNRSTKDSVPLTIDIPSSSPMRPASVPSTPTPIYDWFAQTASQEDQHGSTNREPTSFLDENDEPSHPLEEHGVHPTSPTSVHDEASDSSHRIIEVDFNPIRAQL